MKFCQEPDALIQACMFTSTMHIEIHTDCDLECKGRSCSAQTNSEMETPRWNKSSWNVQKKKKKI